jgi:hypothetical protein
MPVLLSQVLQSFTFSLLKSWYAECAVPADQGLLRSNDSLIRLRQATIDKASAAGGCCLPRSQRRGFVRLHRQKVALDCEQALPIAVLVRDACRAAPLAPPAAGACC